MGNLPLATPSSGSANVPRGPVAALVGLLAGLASVLTVGAAAFIEAGALVDVAIGAAGAGTELWDGVIADAGAGAGASTGAAAGAGVVAGAGADAAIGPAAGATGGEGVPAGIWDGCSHGWAKSIKCCGFFR